jgi:ankyrin repeat protein
MSDPISRLPARPSLEQLRKRAKDLLRAARAGDPAATARFRDADPRWTSAADPRTAILADAQLVIAREHGFRSWGELVHHVGTESASTGAAFLGPLIRPVELRGSRPYTLPDGSVVTTEDVYQMFVAARGGDLGAVRSLIERAPGLATVEYNYTPPIHFAVREGHLAIVELLLGRGADLGYRSYPFGDSLLMMAEDREHEAVAALLRQQLSRRFALAPGTKEIIDAARAGDLARVRAEIVRDPTVVRFSNETGDTPLHHAANGAHLDMVNLLLAAGADPDAVRGDGYRPIHLALMPNFLVGGPRERAAAIVDLLLGHGARHTMFIAAMRGDDRRVRTALRRDPSLANEEDTCHHRPISAATRRGDMGMVRLLLEHGADPSLPEEGAPRGHALWVAVHDRRRDLVKLLLEHGADPNGMVESSGTPMDMARKEPELLALLRAHGGNDPDNSGREELAVLIRERKFAEIERLVRQRPELIQDEEASWGDGIMAGWANQGDNEMLALLIRLGARVPPVSKWAPEYYFKHEATAAFLLQNGMDPNHMNWHRLTLLHHMAAEGHLAKARLLVDHGADIDAIDEEYRSTPLGLAARRGQRALVAFLLERGADPTRSAAPWATPVAWARKRGHEEIAAMLTSAGA